MLARGSTILDVHVRRDAGDMTTLIIGGTGKTGRRVASRLPARGHPVRIATRHGEPRYDCTEPAAERAEKAFTGACDGWTVIRSAFFVENFTEGAFWPEVASGRLSMVAHTAGEPFVSADDLADVANVLGRPPRRFEDVAAAAAESCDG